ncbi:capsular polysaccharide biosynthesis protein [Bordetella petrii]|uniref:capsular polysaccharide biosynthesis protein n=1 Tax=Bordetella petrii TaxID=94624 RepID=UPI0038B3B8C8
MHKLLGARIAPYLGGPVASGTPFVGWGRKASGKRAQRHAARHRGTCWLLEDGFLRSMGNGAQEPPLSVVIDDAGIYYDAGAPSRLEQLVCRALDADREARVTALIAAWRDGLVSKYNAARDPRPALLRQPYVLVVDQTRGDASIRYGQASQASFDRMLAAAMAEHPGTRIILKAHPDVVAGGKTGHFDPSALEGSERVLLLRDHVHPARLLEHAEAVYVVTSQIGFEALLWGKPVRTFGMPFYAGWGLTQDELEAPARRRPASLEALVGAALIDYPRYIDPETGLPCEVEQTLAWLALQRQMRARLPEQITAVGFSRWKKPFVRDFLAGSQVRFGDVSILTEPVEQPIAVWGRKHDDLIRQHPGNANLLRIEDGFLRSVGLGADFIRPLSWVVDDLGIYYDATQPSRLEHLLATVDFPPELCDRARQLRQAITHAGLTKYNVGDHGWQRPAGDNRIILVPGQVESDASIRYGATSVSGNIALLQAVRHANPRAHIIYKPHPDVLAGLRQRGVDETEASRWADDIVGNVSIGAMMSEVDEVHVLTSLAGFEALLRGIPVTTHGQPFYAGWGLTRDLGLAPEVAARRARRLDLDQLVAATLLLYPTYVSRHTRRYTTAERALAELMAWRAENLGGRPSGIRRIIARAFRKA